MKVKIKTECEFDAAHKLNLDYASKCQNLHGHRWKVVVWVEGDYKAKGNGLLFDFTIIKNIIEEFDHEDITDMILINGERVNPTAENIAYKILESLCSYEGDLTFTVRVYENPKSWVEISNG
jgi:6-pyruvoyltetrahydropterin/6-carboxytetrahydropterin synthase